VSLLPQIPSKPFDALPIWESQAVPFHLRITPEPPTTQTSVADWPHREYSDCEAPLTCRDQAVPSHFKIVSIPSR
jgi:hypothetical protein